MIRLTIPSIEKDDLDAVSEALASGYLVQGPRVAAFEEKLAAKVGVPHAIAVSNCTAALQLSLLALDMRPGDLVLVTAYSWIATANAIELSGAQPVFVDVDPETFNMAPAALAEKLSSLRAVGETSRRVRAILPVHTFGQMADMDAINAIAKDVPVIEDAACALGARWNGRQAGAASTMGCFSFHPRKAITTGEGGAITTRDADLAKRLRALRNHGQDPTAPSPDFIMPGFNMRLTEMQAALGQTQLAKLDRIVTARRRLAALYDAAFAKTAITPPRVPAASEPVYQSYVVLLPKEAPRATIIAKMRERGVETTIGTWHMPLTSFYKARYGHRPGEFPATDDVFARSMTLPLYESMTDAQIAEVAQALIDLVAR
ncbi:MAG: DegT/DnrJ/EryC1/StrS family aminotransferase [Labilithrix sp.]|nr:DegT/DnrJ/EryC1/StrS family aminotransferase [Labilithrix sp.]